MGFQHALAMLGGIVSVPLIVGGPFDAKLSNEEKEYLISAGLISSGILSLIQIYRLKLGDSGYYIGTGLIRLAVHRRLSYAWLGGNFQAV
jgi:xanthine/uracil permease